MDFFQKAEQRWAMGREERGLSPDDPFEGDPLAEMEEEVLDSFNYLNVARRQGKISETDYFDARGMIFELNNIVRRHA